MALVNRAINEITVKLVYYGPGLCGKTTNLEQLFKSPKIENKGKMISMTTETDRTLFFDFMPMELGKVGENKIRVGLYTVPGQVFYDATRRLVLRGTDGIVFVCDSQRSMIDSNIESFKNLRNNLIVNSIDPDRIPIVLQYNKRDLPSAMPIEEMESFLNPRGGPAIEASALNGEGVMATFQKAVTLMLANLRNGVDVRLQVPAAAKTAMAAPQFSLPAAAVGLGASSRPPSAPPSAKSESPTPASSALATAAELASGQIFGEGAPAPASAESLPNKDEIIKAVYHHNENTIAILASMIDDLRQQQEMLQKLISKP